MTSLATKRDGSHDFDFQTGRWHIRNERLVKRLQGCTEWETFEATNRAWLLPGGLGNMDDCHRPLAGIVGLSLRLYDPRTRVEYLLGQQPDGDARPPVVRSPGSVGVSRGRQADDGPSSSASPGRDHGDRRRWEQEPPDEGRTWEKNWIMLMTRLS